MNVRRRPQPYGRQSSVFAENRRRRLIIGIAAFLIALATWTYSLSKLSRLPIFQVNGIEVYGADPDIAPAVESAALGTLNGSYLGLFPRSNIFLFPKSAILAAVASSSVRIRTASVAKDLGGKLAISVTEKDPAAIVCPELPDISSGTVDSDLNGCYFADENGFIFEAATTTTEVHARYYMPGGADIGSLATSTSEFGALQRFLASITAIGISPQAVLHKGQGQYELYASPVASSTGLVVIYFDDSAGLEVEASNLAAFWTNESAKAASTGKPPALDYIDLRYGSNVFYRTATGQSNQ